MSIAPASSAHELSLLLDDDFDYAFAPYGTATVTDSPFRLSEPKTGDSQPRGFPGLHPINVRASILDLFEDADLTDQSLVSEAAEIILSGDLAEDLHLMAPLRLSVEYTEEGVVVADSLVHRTADGVTLDEALLHYIEILAEYFRSLHGSAPRLSPRLKRHHEELQRVIRRGAHS